MDALLLRTAGALVVLAVLLDIFFTVLFPASGRGPVRKPLSRAVWRAFRWAGERTAGQRRRDLLSYSGPVLIAATSGAWFALLVAGWAMVYKPALGTGIRAASGAATDTGWATALYFSGFNLTTLGVGDVAPETGLYRLLTVAEAALGFASFSVAATYFLSVYSSLAGRNAFAEGLHHMTGRTGDAAELLARLAADGSDLSAALRRLSAQAGHLRRIHQAHRFYPVLRHFHYREPHYALPRVLLVVLDAAALIRTALDGQHHARAIHSPALDELFEAAVSLVHELVPGVRPRPPTAEDVAAWRNRYAAAAARLDAAGLRVRADAGSVGANEYVAHRAGWDGAVRHLAAAMLYEWDAIEPAPVSQAPR